MSDTPRTDNEAWPRRLYDEEDMSISLGFARTLERELNAAKAEVERLRELLIRYRNETPLGHQPHMIAHEVDAALKEAK